MAGHVLFFYISNLAKSGLQTLMWSDVGGEEDEAVADGQDAMVLCMAFDAHARGDIEVGRQNVENYQHAMKSTFLSHRLCDSPEYCKSSHLIKSFSHHN